MSELTLSSDRIDLWLAHCRDCDERLLDRYRRLMTDEERARSLRFVFERDRRRYVVTRALVRTVLSRYAPTPAEAWRFTENAYGRPQVANEGAAERALVFNVSHTRETVLLGITTGQPLGVDIEEMQRERALLDIADRFFAQDEVAALRALPAGEQAYRFFEYWTLKESYIKAEGMGLSIPLDSFAFDLSDAARVGFSVATTTRAPADRWRFWQIRPAHDHLGAVCAGRAPGGAQSLSLRRVVPLASEEPLALSSLRQS
jgi:4'-phosphopantetheinyl transferase